MARDMNPQRKKLWAESIAKEDKLRLTWFRKNEPRLEATVAKPPTRTVPQEVKDELKDNIIKEHEYASRHAVKPPEEKPPLVDEAAINSIMRPVDPETRKLLYTKDHKNGRKDYLKERCKIIPEQRYFFTECTSWEYGWYMWNHCKENASSSCPRKQIIKEDFYRRRGTERDPDWYRDPIKLSPTVCGCS